MRFKIDENLPVEVADLLRAKMHDAMTIFDQHMIGELDPKVASPSEYPGIIILRPRTQSKARCTCACRKAHSAAQWQ